MKLLTATAFIFLTVFALNCLSIKSDIQIDDSLRIIKRVDQIRKNYGDEVWPGFSKYNSIAIVVRDDGLVLFDGIGINPPAPFTKIDANYSHGVYFSPVKKHQDWTEARIETDMIAHAYSGNGKNDIIKQPHHFFDTPARMNRKRKTNVFTEPVWIGISLHEDFHNFQRGFKAYRERRKQISVLLETNFSEKPSSRTQLANFAKSSKTYRDSVGQEMKFISEALLNKNIDEKKQLICNSVLGEYEERLGWLRAIGKSIYIELEDILMTVEGTGRYIERMFALRLKKEGQMSKRYSDYSKEINWDIEKVYRDVPYMQKNFSYHYNFGMGYSLLLDQIDPNWKVDFFREENSLRNKVITFCEKYSD